MESACTKDSHGVKDFDNGTPDLVMDDEDDRMDDADSKSEMDETSTSETPIDE